MHSYKCSKLDRSNILKLPILIMEAIQALKFLQIINSVGLQNPSLKILEHPSIHNPPSIISRPFYHPILPHHNFPLARNPSKINPLNNKPALINKKQSPSPIILIKEHYNLNKKQFY